jgi:multidrug efflux pump subunit AcrA (membrane-fusion protein)
MRFRRLNILVPCLLIAILVLFLFLHGHHRRESVAAESPPAPTVAVIAAHVGTIANQLSVAGIFQPFQDVDVHGKVSGYIRHIDVDIGDRVHEGQTLAVLEVPELDAEVAGAQAGITETGSTPQ